MNTFIIAMGLGVGNDWHDYVPITLLIVFGPLIWLGIRHWRQAFPAPAPGAEQKAPQFSPPPQPEFDVVQVATYMNDVKADSALAMLKSAGISAFIRRDDCGGMDPPLKLATGGLRLVVRDRDFRRAKGLLKKTKI